MSSAPCRNGGQPVGGKPFGFDGERRVGRTGHSERLLAWRRVSKGQGRRNRHRSPARSSPGGPKGGAERIRLGEIEIGGLGRGVMRNVKRSIRVPTRDVIANLAPPPLWIEPELCKLVTTIPAGEGWAHEIKFDGFRMRARLVFAGVAAALPTRKGLDWTPKYPDIAAAIGALNCRQAYLDSELCAVRPDGTTSFAALQGHGDAPAELVYFAFDLLHVDGEDLMRPRLGRDGVRKANLFSWAQRYRTFPTRRVLRSWRQIFRDGQLASGAEISLLLKAGWVRGPMPHYEPGDLQ